MAGMSGVESVDQIVYLDNAATTWPKPESVYLAVERAMREIGANPGRASHRMSMQAESMVDETRRLVAGLFRAPSAESVVFTLNATDSLNIAIKGLIEPGDKVITGPFEHNSVARPLAPLAKSGVNVRSVRAVNRLEVDLEHVRELCRNGIDFAVMSHVSNVTGCVAPVKEISEIVHCAGGLLILDAAQSAGSLPINMREMGIDILAAPGHKGLYGPMGVGLLVVGSDLPIKPLRTGGSGVGSEAGEHPATYPFRLEGGTANLPGIAGLRAGIRHVVSAGAEEIGKHDSGLAKILIDRLKGMDGVHLYCDVDAPRSGVVSFALDAMDVALTAAILDQSYDIAVRGGLHCAPEAHRTLGTFPEGTVRASFGWFNTEADAERLADAVGEIVAG